MDMFSGATDKLVAVSSPTIFNSTAVPKVDAAKWANNFLAKQGRKTSKTFVEDLEKHMSKVTEDGLVMLYLCFRSYSLKASGADSLDEVLRTMLERSKQALKAAGVDDERIENSKPRKAVIERGAALKQILKTCFWDAGVSEKTLNWGTIAQTKLFTEFSATVARDVLSIPKPKFQQAFYLNAFWSNLDWKDAHEEMSLRCGVLFAMAYRFEESGALGELKLNDRGEVASVSDDLRADLSKHKEFDGSKWSDIADLSKKIDKKSVFVWSVGALLEVAVCVDPRKLLQNKDYKIMRASGADRSNHKKLIISFCQLMMKVSRILGNKGIQLSDDYTGKVSLKVDSEFAKAMYSAYNYIHTFIRTIKRVVYGTKGGADTRSYDEDAMPDISKTEKDVWNEMSEKMKSVTR